ncbi:MBL fold metallo-hydrolase (plasmid) [Cellulomonas sp. WB94]|uniref:MBL fold metallo-hydrolase n=1 Tax=Cellulomonas sp. WB94 TaxID=2173174 RepID=UPI000D5819DF|nr:MBL fold metallo-hydrolase [Cellulomonas sp. WB94]PVU81735.1 MBL fold metallo-hydrolase [Cellulomonas sp. WB94]
MTTVTCWGHACVRLERAGARLVIDPGTYSDLSVLDTADAVLVTHEHPDHVAVEQLRDALATRSHLEVWAPTAVVERLDALGIAPGRVHAVRSGDAFTAAGFAVVVVGEWHEVVHADVPRVANVAYLVDGAVLHPGDSFTLPPATTGVDVLLAPVGGPWLRLAEVIDYVRAVRPHIVVPIHDASLSAIGTATSDRLVASLGGSGEYRRLGPGDELTLG